jgi:hypothetical protein
MTFVYISDASIGFIGNWKWNSTHSGHSPKVTLHYVLAPGYLLNLLILFTFVDHLGYEPQWVQAVAIVAVAGFLFVNFKYFVFPSFWTDRT